MSSRTDTMAQPGSVDEAASEAVAHATLNASAVLWSAFLTAVAGAVLWTVWGDPESPLRAGAVLTFLVLVPGMAIVRLAGVEDAFAQWSLGLALSLAISGLTGAIMLFGAAWEPLIGVTVLATLTLLLIALDLVNRLRTNGRAVV